MVILVAKHTLPERCGDLHVPVAASSKPSGALMQIKKILRLATAGVALSAAAAIGASGAWAQTLSLIHI